MAGSADGTCGWGEQPKERAESDRVAPRAQFQDTEWGALAGSMRAMPRETAATR